MQVSKGFQEQPEEETVSLRYVSLALCTVTTDGRMCPCPWLSGPSSVLTPATEDGGKTYLNVLRAFLVPTALPSKIQAPQPQRQYPHAVDPMSPQGYGYVHITQDPLSIFYSSCLPDCPSPLSSGEPLNNKMGRRYRIRIAEQMEIVDSGDSVHQNVSPSCRAFESNDGQ